MTHWFNKSGRHQTAWLARVAWLLGIWAASIAVLGVVAYVLRVFMESLGLTTGST